MSKHLLPRAARLAASLAALAAVAPLARAQAPATPPTSAATPSLTAVAAPAAPTPPTPEEEKAFLLAYGWMIGKQSGVKLLALTPAELDQVFAGMKLAMSTGATDIPGGEALLPKIQEFIMARVAKVAKDDETKFFATLAKNPNIKKTASGLSYEIVAAGSDAKPKITDEVTAKYKGTLVDGEVFDETTGDKTEKFPLAEVIRGWAEGLQLVGKGGKIKLYIPSDLAYGAQGRPGIPPGSPLIFDVEVVDFGPAAPRPPAGDMSGGLPPELLQQLQQQLQQQGGGRGAPPSP